MKWNKVQFERPPQGVTVYVTDGYILAEVKGKVHLFIVNPLIHTFNCIRIGNEN